MDLLLTSSVVRRCVLSRELPLQVRLTTGEGGGRGGGKCVGEGLTFPVRRKRQGAGGVVVCHQCVRPIKVLERHVLYVAPAERVRRDAVCAGWRELGHLPQRVVVGGVGDAPGVLVDRDETTARKTAAVGRAVVLVERHVPE